MKVYVDTNVLIDFVCRRSPFAEDAKRLFALGYIGEHELMASALSFVNAMYVAHKYGHDEVKSYLKQVASFIDVMDLQGQVVVDMLSTDWADYEDATQHATALKADADCIVTRNKKDFTKSPLPTYTPTELLELLNNRDHLA